MDEERKIEKQIEFLYHLQNKDDASKKYLLTGGLNLIGIVLVLWITATSILVAIGIQETFSLGIKSMLFWIFIGVVTSVVYIMRDSKKIVDKKNNNMKLRELKIKELHESLGIDMGDLK